MAGWIGGQIGACVGGECMIWMAMWTNGRLDGID